MSQWWPAGIPDPDIETGEVGGYLQLILSALGSITSSIYFPGSISNPYEAKTDEPLIIYTDSDYDEIVFTIGPQWATYLGDATITVWFTLADEKRPRKKILDAQGTVADEATGVVKVALTAAQMDIPPGKYLWQIQLRTLDGETVERRVAMAGMAYVKNTLKVP